MANNVHTVKATFGEDIRRFSASNQFTFHELCTQLKMLYGIHESSTLIIKYLDDEGDWIGVTSDHELHVGMRTSQVLKLRVTEQKQQATIINTSLGPQGSQTKDNNVNNNNSSDNNNLHHNNNDSNHNRTTTISLPATRHEYKENFKELRKRLKAETKERKRAARYRDDNNVTPRLFARLVKVCACVYVCRCDMSACARVHACCRP